MDKKMEEIKGQFMEALKKNNIKEEEICNAWLIGSIVHNNAKESSDIDVWACTYREIPLQIVSEKIDITFISVFNFQKQLDEHQMVPMICFHLREEFIIKEDHKFCFNVDAKRLKSVSVAEYQVHKSLTAFVVEF